MSLIINKPGKDINGNEYTFLLVELIPEIQKEKFQVLIQTNCYKDTNIINHKLKIKPEKWDNFITINTPYKDIYTKENIIFFIDDIVIEKLSSNYYTMYTSKKYKNDVYQLNEITGDIELDDDNNPIILNKKDEQIFNKKGFKMNHTSMIPFFCEEDLIKKI